MRFDKLTIKTQEALQEAQSQASTRGHAELVPAHLLLALLRQPEGLTLPLLQKLGLSAEPLAEALEKALASLPRVSRGAQPQLSRAASRVLETAFDEAD